MRAPGRRWRVAPAALSAAVAAVVLATGCSSPTAAGSATPTAAVEGFMRALGAKDADAACAQVSTAGAPLSENGLDQCTEGLRKVIAAISDPREFDTLRSATVTGAAVTGDRATVAAAQITNVPAGYQNDIDLVRINGRWYIDSKQ